MENPQQPQGAQPQGGQRQIQIRDNSAGAEYTNMMQSGFTREEFLITFINIAPPTGRVVSKVMTSPGHLKRIIRALEDSMKKYEDQHGEVEEAKGPVKDQIGFKVE